MDFRGGLRIPGYKDSTKNIRTAELIPAGLVVIPLSQHVGNPAKPAVLKGDSVLKGQKIGEADGRISVNVHSSVSGRVREITPWAHPATNVPVLSVVIESDNLDSPVEIRKNHGDYFRYSPDELKKTIKEAGVVGLGGEAFPSHIKLSPPDDIDAVIINGCESEPYLTCDDRLMRECASDIINGLKIIMYILDASRGIVAVEENKTEAIRLLGTRIVDEPNISLKVLRSRYPQGSEKQLIMSVLKKKVPSGRQPHEQGVVVHNAGTSYAVSKAVMEGLPLISRVITVAGPCIQHPGNYNVRIGMLVRELLGQCGCSLDAACKVVLGGPMMGTAISDIDVPVIKGLTGVLVLPVRETGTGYFPCIKCGRCMDVCPARLMPNMISAFAEKKLWKNIKKYSPQDCTECGACAYACVAKRPLVQHLRLAKFNQTGR